MLQQSVVQKKSQTWHYPGIAFLAYLTWQCMSISFAKVTLHVLHISDIKEIFIFFF